MKILRAEHLGMCFGVKDAIHLALDRAFDTQRIVLLHAYAGSGKTSTAVEFARWFESGQNRGTKGVEFVIGGPGGLSSSILGRAHLRLSLGKMTWTHEMSRVLLIEQIYRAQCIVKKIPYHK